MKKIVVGILIAFLLLLPSIISASELESEKLKVQSTGEGKADLIIEKIIFEQDDYLWNVNDVFVVVKNIGNTTVTKNIVVEGKVIFYRFIIIPWAEYHIYGRPYTPSALEPGKSVKIWIGNDQTYMTFGFLRFVIEVNPNKIIEEEEYSNNFYNERFLKIFGWWFKR
jgi:hypothetical protein